MRIRGVKSVAASTIVALGLSGCAGTPLSALGNMSNEQIGGVLGGLAGTAAGVALGGKSGIGQYIAPMLGGLLGGMLGKEVGKMLNEKDKTVAASTLQQAAEAPVGKPVSWQSEAATGGTGASGTWTTVKEDKAKADRRTGSGACRTIKGTVTTADGRSEETTSMVCKMADGSWQPRAGVTAAG